MFHIRKGILIVRLPAFLFTILKRIASCRKTMIQHSESIAAHDHDFLALYFTESVRYLITEDGPFELPIRAAVLVLKRTTHGWSDVRDGVPAGIVAHFHRGHGVHSIVAG